MIARVTIVGRPNVGKSSLFNALSGHKIAIVSDQENTTRDIVEYQIHDEVNHLSYVIADSGGLTTGSDDAILQDIRKRVEESVSRSDLILFVLEYDKITALDEEIAKKLRRAGKRVFLIANKADNRLRTLEAFELLSLGFDDFAVISASHAHGLDEVRTKIAAMLKAGGYDYEEEDYSDEYLKLSIIGRPNVGKSSLVNAITGENRAMVRDMPGTTRDSIDSIVEWKVGSGIVAPWTQEKRTTTPLTKGNEQNEEGLSDENSIEKIVLIDTAGIRRVGKVGNANIEQWSVMRAERAIARSDVVAIVVDADEGITSQDKHVVERALEEKKGIILVFNKWDKILDRPTVKKLEEVATEKTKNGKPLQRKPENNREVPRIYQGQEEAEGVPAGSLIMSRYLEYIGQEFDFLSYVTPVFTSAISGKRIDSIIETALHIREERKKRVKTGVFNNFLEQIVLQHAPTGNKKSHNPKIYYWSQVDINPPKFVISVNNTKHFHFSYARYIENRIRDFFGFQGTPIVIELKGRESIFKKGGGLKEERLKDRAIKDHTDRENDRMERENVARDEDDGEE